MRQDTGVAASGETFVVSVWMLRGPTASAGQKVILRLMLSDASEPADLLVEPTERWTRYQISTTFTGGAGQTAEVRIVRPATSAAPDVLLFGAQCEKGYTARGFYVATDGNAGADAGRGAFQSGATTHADDSIVKEVVLYRHHLADDGVHPLFALRDLLNRGRLAESEVDLDAYDLEFFFLKTSRVRRSGIAVIDETERLSEHIEKLREEALIDLWFGEDGTAKVRFSFRPNQPGASILCATDESNIVAKSSRFAGNAESRITRAIIYYNLIAGETGDRPDDFANAQVVVDLAVESLSGPKTRVVFSKWIYRQAEAIALAGRLISRFRRGARRANWVLDLKDAPDFGTGDLIALNSIDVLMKSGSAAVRNTTFWQIVQRDERREDGMIHVEALEASGRRYAIIGPSGLPDYGSASDAQKQYGYIGDSNNLVDSGNEDGYYIL